MDENVKKILDKVNQYIVDGTSLKEQMDQLEEWDSISEVITNIGKIGNFITNVVLTVELASKELVDELEELKSEDKLEAAAKFIDDQIELPWYLEIADGPVFKLLISYSVYYMNTTYGNDWNLDAIRAIIEKGAKVTEFLKYVS